MSNSVSSPRLTKIHNKLQNATLSDVVSASIIIAFVLGYLKAIGLRSMDTAFVLHMAPEFPANSAAVIWARHSWSLIHQLGYLGFEVGLSHTALSYIFSILTAILLIIGISSLLYATTKSAWLAILLAPILSVQIVIRELVANYDYQFIGSPHISAQGMAIVVFALGLASVGKNRSAGFAAGLAVSIHAFLGLWALFLVTTFFVIEFLRGEKKDAFLAFQGALIGIALSTASLVYQYLVIAPNRLAVENTQALEAYMSLWDYHRSLDLNYVSIFAGIIIFCAIAFYYLRVERQKINNIQTPIIVAAVSIITSVFLYFISSFTLGYLKELLDNLLLGRFVAFNTVLAPVLIAGILFHWTTSRRHTLSTKHQLLVIMAVAFIVLVMVQMRYLVFRTTNINELLIAFAIGIVGLFAVKSAAHVLPRLPQIGKVAIVALFAIASPIALNVAGIQSKDMSAQQLADTTCPPDDIVPPLLVTSWDVYKALQRTCELPALIDPSSFDFVPYTPWTAEQLSQIVTYGYGVDFAAPPEKARYKGSLHNRFFREIWENRSGTDWALAGQKLKVHAIATPPDWSLALPVAIETKQYKVYRIFEPQEDSKPGM